MIRVRVRVRVRVKYILAMPFIIHFPHEFDLFFFQSKAGNVVSNMQLEFGPQDATGPIETPRSYYNSYATFTVLGGKNRS